MPPDTTFEQIKDAASALMHGDEDRRDVIKQGLKTKLQEFLPHLEGAAVPGSHHREQSVTTALTTRHSSQKGGVTDDR